MFWKRYVHLEVYTKPEFSKKQILSENCVAFMQNMGQQQQQNRDSAKRDEFFFLTHQFYWKGGFIKLN